jgi:hypothetical protein
MAIEAVDYCRNWCECELYCEAVEGLRQYTGSKGCKTERDQRGKAYIEQETCESVFNAASDSTSFAPGYHSCVLFGILPNSAWCMGPGGSGGWVE